MNYEIHTLKNFFRLIRLDDFNEVEAMRWKDRYLSDLARGQAPTPVELARDVLHEMYLNRDDADRTSRGVSRFLSMVDEAPLNNVQRAALLLKLGPVCQRDTLLPCFSEQGAYAINALELNEQAPAPFFYTEFFNGRVTPSGFGFMVETLCEWDDFKDALIDRLGYLKDPDILEASLETPSIAKAAANAPLVFKDEALQGAKVIAFAIKHEKFGLSAHGKILKYLVEHGQESLVVDAVEAISRQIMRLRESDLLKASILGSVKLWLNEKVDRSDEEIAQMLTRVNALLDGKRKLVVEKDTGLSLN